ncbi:unnamed protein product [Brachionus calyciflorus]|uniref:G-protein coupled receptors family 1 profile domain-containing protein n=1 Tax=Brachionus calyciflorus TaxID=104777 RepID=A0A813XAY8_9BILA|nr:unnamed protein product [Brachionus calyciflorus]
MNFSNENLTATDRYDNVISTNFAVNYIDLIIRLLSLIIHLVYFLIILLNKPLRSITYLYMHHVNLISLVYILHYVAYFTNRTVYLSDDLKIEFIFCTLSELTWSFLYYTRTYSILLLAIYRYLAVFYINIYKNLNSSIYKILIPLGMVWLSATLFILILKFSLQTTHSIFFCSPGFSNDLTIIIVNFCLVNIFCNLVPISLVVFIYLKILKKLRNINKNLSFGKKDTKDLRLKKSEMRFAKQFILINIFNVLSTIISIMVNFQMVLAAKDEFRVLDSLFLELRPIIRTIFISLQTALPILSIIYNPEILFFKKIAEKVKISFTLTS